MATAATGWKCTHSTSVVEETATTQTIRVICYWQNDGWTYDINWVSAWVYCDGVEKQVADNISVNTTSSGTASKNMGSYDFTINKSSSSKSVSCYAKITSSSSYVSGTKSSSATSVTINAISSHTVSYDANGGSGAPSSQTKKVGTNLTLSSTKPTRSGYTFKGWSMSDEGLGTTYSSGGSFTQDVDVTLFAVWEVIPRVKVKSGSSWVTGDLMVKSGSSYIPVSTITKL